MQRPVVSDEHQPAREDQIPQPPTRVTDTKGKEVKESGTNTAERGIRESIKVSVTGPAVSALNDIHDLNAHANYVGAKPVETEKESNFFNSPCLPQLRTLPSTDHNNCPKSAVTELNENPKVSVDARISSHGTQLCVLPKWTRLAKPVTKETTQKHSTTRCYGKSGTEQVDFQLDLPGKCQQVLKIDDGIPLDLVKAEIQPTNLNDLPNVELSWAWEPMYREGACKNNTGKRSLHRIYSRNMGG